MFWACLIVGLSYIGESERKFQSDNGSAALLRRRTAFFVAWDTRWWWPGVAGETEQLTVGGNFQREDRWRN